MNPGTLGGRPHVRGKAVPVHAILFDLSAGRSVAELLAAQPTLDEEDVRQALFYAALLAEAARAAKGPLGAGD